MYINFVRYHIKDIYSSVLDNINKMKQTLSFLFKFFLNIGVCIKHRCVYSTVCIFNCNVYSTVIKHRCVYSTVMYKKKHKNLQTLKEETVFAAAFRSMTLILLAQYLLSANKANI